MIAQPYTQFNAMPTRYPLCKKPSNKHSGSGILIPVSFKIFIL